MLTWMCATGLMRRPFPRTLPGLLRWRASCEACLWRLETGTELHLRPPAAQANATYGTRCILAPSYLRDECLRYRRLSWARSFLICCLVRPVTLKAISLLSPCFSQGLYEVAGPHGRRRMATSCWTPGSRPGTGSSCSSPSEEATVARTSVVVWQQTNRVKNTLINLAIMVCLFI